MTNLSVYLNTLRQKGYLAYEYNPFHNYQTDVDLCEKDGFIIPKGCAVDPNTGEILKFYNETEEGKKQYKNKQGKIIKDAIEYSNSYNDLYAKAGSLIDFDTDKLNFDLEHPVDIEVLPSYDGSVNLILNDDKNIPRLINSRFSVREKNKYEIVDRIGENDTNVYNSKTFDKDTSLYFLYEQNPIISYTGFVKGVLPVGLYCFYFTYCDADNNESDYIAETGLIPVFLGSNGDPSSIDGGIKNQVSHKGIRLRLTDLDKSYNYIKVYYVRYFADYLLNRVAECKKLYKRFPINSSTLFIQITGNELTEDLDPNIINITRFNPKSILTLAQCKNMLFFGNVVKNSDNYRELTDCALRIIPRIKENDFIDVPSNERYVSNDPLYGYYSVENIYNKVGYFNLEYYRFGVVFIYNNGTLSNVYNVLGGNLTGSENENENKNPNISGNLFDPDPEGVYLVRNYIKVDENGWIKSDKSYELSGSNLNSKGVCFINKSSIKENLVLGIKFEIPKEVIKFLKEDLEIRGLFFVRQKCIPNILAQCYLMPMDKLLHAPVIKYEKEDEKEDEKPPYKYVTECFVEQGLYKRMKGGIFGKKITDSNRRVINDYDLRLYEYKKNNEQSTDSDSAINSHAYAAICPDFLLNLPYYNQIFNGNKFKLQALTTNSNLKRNGRFYVEPEDRPQVSNSTMNTVTINTVTEDVPTVAIEDEIFKLEIGETEEAYKFEYCEKDTGTYDAGEDEDKDDDDEKSYERINKLTNIVRGKYSPYLAIYSPTKLETGVLYNIYQEYLSNTTQEFLIRMDNSEPFYAISDRYNFEQILAKNEDSYSLVCYKGDCYINTFTYRLNRNFNDPSLPNNDVIIDEYTWRDHYKSEDSTEWANISRSDLNAVLMGSWITIKVRSAMNYALRSEDHSFVSEEALMGSPRSYYPRNKLMWRGENKMPDSYLYNDAYRATLGYKCYYTLDNLNYLKDSFSNRIQYSAIAILDSYKNNYRYSLSTYFRDYSSEYGGITKLLGFEGYLLVVFEHAIGIAVINERVLAGTGDGEPVFINTNNVLPEELTIITDTYGSQWTESVIKSEAGYVYGVDTIAKKIWRVKGQQIEILSDFKVNRFLNDNISLGERELSPIIGLKNVKTHYNNNKKDILFTFYDDIYLDEEKVWNLCYNEILGEFITFYSWVPSYSENIDTQFFSFDRNTSKCLSLLLKSNYNIDSNIGVLVESPVLVENENPVLLEDLTKIYSTFNLHYKNPKSVLTTIKNKDGTTTQKYITDDIDDSEIKFKIEKDHWGNYKYFNNNGEDSREVKVIESLDKIINDKKENNISFNGIIILLITPYIENQEGTSISKTEYPTETIAITWKRIVNNQGLTDNDKNYPKLTTDFYLHGRAGIFNVAEDLYPTHWYGDWHPFEFEFVVNDNIGYQKIFLNLVIISNKAEPESFHFEIEGDNYEFSQDKRTMYYRQESTKELFLSLGSDMLFDRKYTDIAAEKLTQELYYRAKNNDDYDDYEKQYTKFDKVYPVSKLELVQQIKSTIFPLYYERVDKYNDIYHSYAEMTGNNYDFKNLSGSEIKWDRYLNQFNVVTHIKNSPIDLYGRLRGNSRYKEGKWNIQIPSIIFSLKNEDKWKDKIPPIVINSQNIPNDLIDTKISKDKLPNIYSRTEGNVNDYIDTKDWTYRKETPIRDKWIKIRIRYSGKNLAVIHSLVTLYNVSYS